MNAWDLHVVISMWIIASRYSANDKDYTLSARFCFQHIPRDKVRLWCSAHGKSVPKEVKVWSATIWICAFFKGNKNVKILEDLVLGLLDEACSWGAKCDQVRFTFKKQMVQCLFCQFKTNVYFANFRLLDFYERSDSFILILSRPSNYKVCGKKQRYTDAVTMIFWKLYQRTKCPIPRLFWLHLATDIECLIPGPFWLHQWNWRSRIGWGNITQILLPGFQFGILNRSVDFAIPRKCKFWYFYHFPNCVQIVAHGRFCVLWPTWGTEMWCTGKCPVFISILHHQQEFFIFMLIDIVLLM